MTKNTSLKDFTVAFAGFRGQGPENFGGTTIRQIAQDIRDHGGKYKPMISDFTTHVVATCGQYESPENDPVKARIQKAKELNKMVVTYEWLAESLKASEPVNVGDHLLYPVVTIAFAQYSENNHQSFSKKALPLVKEEISQLGGKVCPSTKEITHLVATPEQYKRTPPSTLIEKVESGIREVRIVTYDWLAESLKASRWVDVGDHLLGLTGFTITFADYTEKGHGYFSTKTLEDVIKKIESLGGKYDADVRRCTCLVATSDQYKADQNGSILEAKTCVHEIRIVSYDWLAVSLKTSKWTDERKYLLQGTDLDSASPIKSEGPSPSQNVWRPGDPIRFAGSSDTHHRKGSVGDTDTETTAENGPVNHHPSKSLCDKLKRGAYRGQTLTRDVIRLLMECADRDWTADGHLCQFADRQRHHRDRVKGLAASEAQKELRRLREGLHRSLDRENGPSPHLKLPGSLASTWLFQFIWITIEDVNFEGMARDVTKACVVLLSIIQDSHSAILKKDNHIVGTKAGKAEKRPSESARLGRASQQSSDFNYRCPEPRSGLPRGVPNTVPRNPSISTTALPAPKGKTQT